MDERDRILILEPIKVRSKKKKWSREAFLDAGEATFGE
jgi:hypothetical protein